MKSKSSHLKQGFGFLEIYRVVQGLQIDFLIVWNCIRLVVDAVYEGGWVAL